MALILIATVLVVVLLAIFWAASHPNNNMILNGSNETLQGYECGFSIFHNNSDGFSIKFFQIGILFLLVDLEISLFLPFFSGLHESTLSPTLHLFSIFFILGGILLLLLLEVGLGGLSWAK